jgi:type IV secretory pathway VirB10-like protein
MSQSLSPARLDRRATTTRGSVVGGLVVAGLLHAALIAVTLIAWEHKLDIVDQSPPNVPVDLVSISDKTNVAPIAPKAEPKPPEPPQPETRTTPAPTPPPPTAAAAPPQPAPQPKPETRPEPALKPIAKPPEAKKPDPKKTASEDFNDLLSSLTAPPPKSAHAARTGDRPVKGIGDMNMMTADLAAMLKSQMSECWSPPAGAPHPERLVPRFRIQLNRDGTVARQPQLLAESSPSGDPFMVAAVEAARRAIMTCGPYRLPPDRYDQWKDSTVDFNPRDMAQ